MTVPGGRTRGLGRAGLTLGLLLALAVGGVLFLRQRAQARLPGMLGARAAAAGLALKMGPAEIALGHATVRNLELAFAGVPGVRAVADVATLNAGAGQWPRVALGHVIVEVDAGALVAVDDLARRPLWAEVPLSWQRLTVRYRNRLFGQAELDDVRVSRPAPEAGTSGATPSLSLHAGRVTVGARRWTNVDFGLQRRGQMVELALGRATAAGAPVVVSAFPPQGGAAVFVATVAHPPLAAVARALGVSLGPAFDGTRVGGSVSVTVPDEAARPAAVRLELVIAGWPPPAAEDAATILGSTLSFGARMAVTPGATALALEPARMSTALFSLFGTGSLGVHPDLRLALELSGELTCAQVRGNLPPSPALTAVSDYLAPAAAKVPAATLAARARERATMRLQLDTTLARVDEAHLAWKLDAACGLAGFAFGAFASSP